MHTHKLLAGITAVSLFLLSSAVAQPQQPLSLEQIMAEPDWIGNPVEQAWWDINSDAVFYTIKASNSPLRETHRVGLDRSNAAAMHDTTLTVDAAVSINTDNPVLNRSGDRVLFVRHGDIFYRDLSADNQQPLQLTRTRQAESNPAFMSTEHQIMYQLDNQWFVHNLRSNLTQLAAELTLDDEPSEDHGPLGDRQLDLFSTLRRQRDEQEASEQREQARRSASDTDAEQQWYLGKDRELVASSLSPNGRWMLVVTSDKGYDDGREGKMPEYVTRSGYVDIEDVRTRVGLQAWAPQQITLLDLRQHQQHDIPLDALPGIATDPLAELREAQELEPLDGLREVSISDIEWSANGEQAAIMLRAIDNKDRWIATVNFDEQQLLPQHRLTDPAWINWTYNDYGWLPADEAGEQQSLWYLSEQSGFSHLYVKPLDSAARQLTSGEWEVSSPSSSRDGSHFYFIANRETPADYELFRYQLADDTIQQLSQLHGVEQFSLSPSGQHALLLHSASYTPTQLAVVDVTGDTPETIKLTDTRTSEYQSIDWQQPQFVDVPSLHDAGQPIRSKLYLPDFGQHPGQRPVVLFVHGAGYTQNTHQKFPYYFREQMFHNLLTQRGYIVLDMDFRASKGYGRDWRTAIYRHMGKPELQDLQDGIAWLADKYPADIDRVGIYGGSYGGFMALMAMFNAPQQFVAGAALRPVTDWTAYNHFYTANILNTPELDPEAYTNSSPIDHAEGLQGHLLIAHGMLDDNVFYQDSVRLAQRLIELRKDNWELAGYPLEPHSFIYSDSWYDEYRRVLQLFERTIGN